MPAAPWIERLTVYPIKGLRGIDVKQARLSPFGLENDRRLMLTDVGGRFLSQRTHPELTHFEVAFGVEGTLTVSHPEKGSIVLPLRPDGRKAAGGALASGQADVSSQAAPSDQAGASQLARVSGISGASRSRSRDVAIWGDRVQATTVSPEADAFFSDVLAEAVELVWMPDDADRVADPEWAPDGHRVSFADGFPILVLGSASITELNARLVTPVSSRRFRANVLIGGSAAWAEDEWRTLETESARLDLVKPCARCVVIATDQQTGERSREPTATLATYRVRHGKVMVGMNAVAGPSGGLLTVGQPIRII